MPRLDNLHLTKTPAQYKAINQVKHHAIILAASGMMTAGRILHHLKQNPPRSECHIIVAGYQGRGTLGREIVEGADEVLIHRKPYKVRAQIHTVGGMSAHADQGDLMRWLGEFQTQPHVCIIHGEEKARQGLRQATEQQLGWTVTSGKIGNRIDLAKL
ncbi:MAG: metallo-beta-lactamase family protein [Saprospiraceae bacterium]|jgi:metallo-beta-lactamase family protein